MNNSKPEKIITGKNKEMRSLSEIGLLSPTQPLLDLFDGNGLTLIVGEEKSGKTSLVKALIKSQLPALSKLRVNAFVPDGEYDLISFLASEQYQGSFITQRPPDLTPHSGINPLSLAADVVIMDEITTRGELMAFILGGFEYQKNFIGVIRADSIPTAVNMMLQSIKGNSTGSLSPRWVEMLIGNLKKIIITKSIENGSEPSTMSCEAFTFTPDVVKRLRDAHPNDIAEEIANMLRHD